MNKNYKKIIIKEQEQQVNKLLLMESNNDDEYYEEYYNPDFGISREEWMRMDIIEKASKAAFFNWINGNLSESRKIVKEKLCDESPALYSLVRCFIEELGEQKGFRDFTDLIISFVVQENE